MARSRRLDALRSDSYKRADCEGATDRHPATDVTRYVNQGRAALRDLMISARGRSYFRSDTPWTITTTAGTSIYTSMPSGFYQLISVRLNDQSYGYNLEPFTQQDEPFLRAPVASVGRPTHYELRASGIELLPLHDAGLSVIVEYIPALTDLVDDDDEADGVDGWEDYIVDYAAMQMASKDDDDALVRRLERSMAMLERRISSLAPKRDRFRAERVKDVRGFGTPWWPR